MSRAAGVLILTKVRTSQWPDAPRSAPPRRRLPGRLLRATLTALTWPVRWLWGSSI